MIMKRWRVGALIAFLILALSAGIGAQAAGPFFINEILVNPPSTDNGFEYLEIRGTPNATVPSDLYFVAIEGDGTNAGVVDVVWQISANASTVGSNGFIVRRDSTNWSVDAGATTVTLDFSPDIENGSNTYLLIQATGMNVPVAGSTDIDSNNDGTIDGTVYSSWTVLDSVGIIEDDGASNFAYAALAFRHSSGTGTNPTGTVTTVGSYNADYLMRQGSSTGSTAGDWVAADVAGSGVSLTIDGTNSVPSSFGGEALDHVGATNPGGVVAGDPPTFVDLIDGVAGVVGAVNAPDYSGAGDGIAFSVSDTTTAAGDITVAITGNSNTGVIPNANISLVNLSGGNWRLDIGNPAAVGRSTITLTATDTDLDAETFAFKYAASAATAGRPNITYHFGMADASTSLDFLYPIFVVANDEDQVIRRYTAAESGLPMMAYTDGTPITGAPLDLDGTGREVDVEGSTSRPISITVERVYAMGSHSNSSAGAIRVNRYRVFAGDYNAVSDTITFIGHYDHLRTDLIAWDTSNAHGLGANFFGLSASAASGVIPEAVDGSGFNIEGLTFIPGSTTQAYIAFRAPIVPASARTQALIVPVTNFATLAESNDLTVGSATFGAPIQLNLGGRGIRSIECTTGIGCLILAGSAASGTDFAVYEWSGVAGDPAYPIEASLIDLNPEGLIPFDNGTDFTSIAVVSDDGDLQLYGDSTIAKDEVVETHRRFRQELITLGAPTIGTSCPALTVAQGSAGSVVLSAFDLDSIVNGASITSAAYPGLTLSGFTPASMDGGTATATLNVANFLPIGARTVTVTFTNDDAQSQPCSVTVTVNATGGLCPVTNFISEIQGTGTTSPFATQVRTVQGVVVGDFQTSARLSGFFIQEEDTQNDSDSLTSEGVFVFDGASPSVNVNVGDLVCVTGTVTEFNTGSGTTLTQMASSPTVTVNATSQPAPTRATVTLPFASTTFLERYEGMSVIFTQSLYLSDMFNLAQFGEIWLSSGNRLFQPTQIVEPGVTAVAQQTANNLNRILIDDGTNTQYVNPTAFLPAGGTLRLGWTTINLTGVLSQGFSNYRIQPDTNYPTFDSSANPRPTDAPNVGGNVQVVTFNVLNYFNGDGMGGGFPTARGAATLAEFERQRDKLLSALIELDADIYSLIEIENDGFAAESAVQDIVNGLNDHFGAGTFAAVDPGIGLIGTDQITLAQIYRTDTVTTVGAAMIDLDAINNRPTFAQTYSVDATGGVFTVVGNHFKSKGCGGSTGLNTDQGDGQSCFNLQRIQQAQRLLTFINGTIIPTSGDPDVLVTGDLNSYFNEDPIDALLAGGIVHLINDPFSYSYLFQRQSGSLDYVMSTASLVSQVTGADKWHVNADEPPFFDYDPDFEATYHHTPGLEIDTPYWTADHDPIIVGLNVAAPIIVDRTNAALISDPMGDVTAIAEGATVGDQFCVRLPADAASDVTVTLTVDSAVTGEIDLVNASLVNVGDTLNIVILAADDATLCNAGQIVGVSAVNDSIVEGAETLTDAIDMTAMGYIAAAESVTVYDTGATMSPALQMQEGGNGSYTFVLTAPPGIRQANPSGAYETVTITLTGYNGNLLAVSPTSLMFTRATWNTPQTVNVTAKDDATDRGARYNSSVLHNFTSNVAPQNSLYGGAAPNLMGVRQRFSILDNDQIVGQTQSQAYYDALNLAAWLELTPSAPALEGTASYALNVQLAGQPADGEIVVVDLATQPGVTISPATLTFTHHNWNVPQSIQVLVPSNGSADTAYGVSVQATITDATSAAEFVGAVNAVTITVTDTPVVVPPAPPEQAAPAFAPAAETTQTDEGSVSE
jgi:predicted extracellular nuclease